MEKNEPYYGEAMLYSEELEVPVEDTLRVAWALRELDKRIPGQHTIKNTVAMAMSLYRMQVRYGYDYMTPPVLFIGATGSGKTFMAEQMSEIMKIPVKICGLSRVMNSGYKGVGLGHVVKDIVLAEHGILWLDEMDKLVAPTNQHHDGFKLAMQHELLDILGGATVQLAADEFKFMFNSKQFMICMSGAFVGLADIIRRRLAMPTGRRSVGFLTDAGRAGETASEAEVLALAEPEDLIAYGMLPELVGRIHDIAVFDPVGEREYYAMFDFAVDKIMGRYTALFQEHGRALIWSDEAKRACAARAAAHAFGYRGLVQVIHRVCKFVFFASCGPLVTVTKDMVDAAYSRSEKTCDQRTA